MENTDSTNITCPSCGHGIDCHRPEEDAYIDVCWAVAAPATDGDPEGLCPCSLRPSEIAGGLLDHAREGILALVAEVERLRGQLDNPRDEYHTMDELYHYRMLYNAMGANLLASHGGDVHKSWRHADGKLCFGGGWFIVTMQLPTGQVSNHYRAEHWDAFRVPEREHAAAWDGHTPDMAAERMERYVRGEA